MEGQIDSSYGALISEVAYRAPFSHGPWGRISGYYQRASMKFLAGFVTDALGR